MQGGIRGERKLTKLFWETVLDRKWTKLYKGTSVFYETNNTQHYQGAFFQTELALM